MADPLAEAVAELERSRPTRETPGAAVGPSLATRPIFPAASLPLQRRVGNDPLLRPIVPAPTPTRGEKKSPAAGGLTMAVTSRPLAFPGQAVPGGPGGSGF